MALNFNNPGNLSITSDIWKGQVIPGDSLRFVTFSNPIYGYRALFIDLYNKIKNGFNTIEKIIYRYAPPNDNNTEAYINYITSITGYNRTYILNPALLSQVFKIGYAIARFETGTVPVDKDIKEGFFIAFDENNDKPDLFKQFLVLSTISILLLKLNKDI